MGEGILGLLLNDDNGGTEGARCCATRALSRTEGCGLIPHARHGGIDSADDTCGA